MPGVSGYQPLADYLAGKKADSWEATFSEIEEKLGRPLPQSAYRYQAWWANQSGSGHSQTHGWRSVGWRTSKLDLERRRVRFERDRRAGPARAGAPGTALSDLEALYEHAAKLTGVEDRQELTVRSLRALIQREAAAGLIALGGTMPDFQIPPRERPGF
jgi:hypothetical protein